jgi:hypothetical protein
MPNSFNDMPDDKLPKHYAVVYAPRRTRPRFQENTVTFTNSAEEAIALADDEKNMFAARICGPSVSSEGSRMYYLVYWLEA